jgi:hypothetical protein
MVTPSDVEKAYRAREANDKIIKSGLQPGEMLAGQDAEVQGQVTDVRYKDLIPMWNTKTGIVSYTHPYMMDAQLKKRHPDGTAAFTFADPGLYKPPEGGHYCYLHPEAEGSDKLFAMGYEPCFKEHIPSQRALEMHMRKHSQAWEAVQVEATRERDEETRLFQRSQVEVMRQLLNGGSIDVSKVESAERDTKEEAPLFTSQCEQCVYVAESSSYLGAHNKLAGHMKKNHPQKR